MVGREAQSLYGPPLAWNFTGIFLAVQCLVPRGFYIPRRHTIARFRTRKAFLCFVGNLETTSVCSDTSVLGKNA